VASIGRAALPAAVAVFTAFPAAAQHSQPSEAVTVWAAKRPEPIQNVPMALSVLSAEDLNDSGIADLKSTSGRLPTLTLQHSVSAVTTTLRIRRIGNLGNIPTFEPAVGLFVDGAFRSRSMLGAADLPDVERIEVLSGPQSMLYGKDASAGVIAIYTREPGDGLNAIAEVTGGWIEAPGSPRLSGVKLALNGPLSSAWSGGFAGIYSAHGRTLANALPGGVNGNNQSRGALRGQLVWRPGERWKARLLLGYTNVADDEGESDLFFAAGARSTAVADTLRQLGLTSGCPDNVPHNRISCATAPNTLDLEASDLTLITEYELTNGWRLTSITGWDRYEDRRNDDDTMQLSTPLLYFHDSEKGTSLQEELRLISSQTARAPWLAGLFYYTNEYERGTRGKRAMFGPVASAAFDPVWPSIFRIPLALPGQDGLHDSRLRTDYLGVFGQLTWNLSERLSITSGTRWQNEKKVASINNSTTAPGVSVISTVLTPTVSPSGAPVNGATDRAYGAWAWSVTPQYRVADHLMFYATVASGTKSGGFNTGFGNAPLAAREFKAERSHHYALGSRATFARGRGRLGAALFYTEYTDYQDAAFVSAQFTVGNAGRVRLRGAELEGRIELGADSAADVAISLADLVYARNTTGMCYPGRAPDGSLPGSCDLTGRHPIDAPEWSTHLGFEHSRSLGSARVFTRLDWSWTDEYRTSFSSDPRLRQKPYHQLALRLGLRFGDYEAVLSGDNLLNERIVSIDSVLNFFNDASYQSFLEDARRYSLTLRMHFQPRT
jgi:iron complex outermembrane recepter protein